jgi:hypothetical protein
MPDASRVESLHLARIVGPALHDVGFEYVLIVSFTVERIGAPQVESRLSQKSISATT